MARDTQFPPANPPHDAVLSLAMIVRDGGQNLAPLLAAATPWVDEMVVGDTGSRDGSPEVCRAHGARVLDVGWRDDFAWARNRVLERCRSAWVVVLDADEQLAPADWQDLRCWVADNASGGRVQAGSMITRNYLPQRHGRRGWTPVPENDPHALGGGAPSEGFVVTTKVRIFPNLPDVRFRGAVHETVEASLWDSGIPIVAVPWPVHHFGYLSARGDKDARYLHLAHLKTTAQPHDAKAWAELADCAIAVGDQRQALVAIERSLLLEPLHPDRRLTAGWLRQQTGDLVGAEAQLATLAGLPAAPNTLLAEAAHLRAQIAVRNDRPRQAVRLVAEALRRCPDNGHFHNTLGSINLLLGRGQAAGRALQRASRMLPHLAEPLLNLALLHESADQPERAREYYRAALERDPRNARARAGLAKNSPAPVA